MSASFQLDAVSGGRLSSLRVGDFELIYNNPDESPTSWGAYPMLPWAGRVDHGRFQFDGTDYQLPVNHGDHAMHGTAFTSAWQDLGPNHLALELDDRWPFGGTASHRGTLNGDARSGSLVLELAVAASGKAMPAMVGWHPWFNRLLSPDGPSGDLQIAEFGSAEMYQVDDQTLPTGALISPPEPGPWDHPFRSMTQPLVIEWASQLRLILESSCDHWVIYNRPEHALCVEPQSGPPDIFNNDRFDRAIDVLQPGEELSHTFTLSWELL